VTLPAPSFDHLRRLTDRGGLYEHALGTSPRREHGYCVDDVARALVVACRATQDDGVSDLREHYLVFLLAAQDDDGRFRNRRAGDLSWTDHPSVEDCWGRALWGLGAVVASDAEPHLRASALAAFDRGARWRSPWSRAMAFAALGAAEVLRAAPEHTGARSLLVAAASMLDPAPGEPRRGDWPWPERRLTYANAVVPDALLVAGHETADDALVTRALRLLGWLLDTQTRDGHLSVVPVGGRGPDSLPGPGFDQQPIEVAALADACLRAYTITGDRRWRDGIERAVAWFLGANDAGTVMYDAATGGGCDGLERTGRNENQGAESTLAALSTLQVGRLLLAPIPL
jgi:hypothetical protein